MFYLRKQVTSVSLLDIFTVGSHFFKLGFFQLPVTYFELRAVSLGSALHSFTTAISNYFLFPLRVDRESRRGKQKTAFGKGSYQKTFENVVPGHKSSLTQYFTKCRLASYDSLHTSLQKRSAMSALKLVPAIEENFFKDRCFADQRVAGANPYQLWRVTNKEGKSKWRRKILRFIYSMSLKQRKLTKLR